MSDQLVLFILAGCGVGISIATWFRPLHAPYDRRFHLTRFVVPLGTIFAVVLAINAPPSSHNLANAGIFALIGVVVTTGWAINEIWLTIKERHLKK